MTHVAVAGAGPAGAALAYLLARGGVEVTLLERHTDFAREFRGEGLMPSGRDALTQMGLGPALERLPQSRVSRIEWYLDASRVFGIEIGEFAGLPVMVSQPAMLEMLVEQASRFSSFRLERGTTVRDVLRGGSGAGERIAGLRVEGSGGPREIRADFVIGTDGRASVLRKRAGLDAERPREFFDVVWFKAPMPKGDSVGTVRFYLARGHFSITLPAPDGRLQLAWIIEKGRYGELRARGMDAWVDNLAGVLSDDLAAHLREHRSEITSPFLLDVVCDHLERWTMPGLLLLGDAAHPMSPVGAQGINLALRDALVAANRLLPALQGGVDPADLDRAALLVQNERLPEIAEIQTLQRRLPRILFQRTLLARVLTRTVLPLAVRTGLAALFAGTVLSRFANGVTSVELAPQ